MGLPEKTTGIASFDATVTAVAELEAMITLVRYAKHLDESDKPKRARNVLDQLVPELKGFSSRASAFLAQVDGLPGETEAALKEQPLLAVKVGSQATKLVTRGRRIHASFPDALRNGEAMLNALISSELD